MDPDRTPASARPPLGQRAHLQFPSTSWDLLRNAVPQGEQSAGALTEFADRYYAAVRAFINGIAATPADAEDLTQRFFETVVLSGRLFAHADRAKGAFRPYLKQAIRNFLVDERRRAARSINPEIRPDGIEDGWNTIAGDSSPGPDDDLLRAWARSLVTMAVARLEALCEANDQRQHYQLFVRRYLADPDHPPTWGAVGEPFGLGEKVARSRAETAVRHFRELLRDLVASDVGSTGSVDHELQTVIGLL
jgi:DNA-directed RNA polymerase specialized sigma24 family protein